MTLNEQIMKLQTYKMFDGEDTVYVERDDVLKLLEQEPILDKIRAEIEGLTYYWCEVNPNSVIDDALQIIDKYKLNGTPLEPCKDAISRKAVMKALCDDCELCKDGVQTCFSKCEEYHFLATLPSIQPKTDVLDKIRAEIEEKYGDYDICEWFEDYDYEENDISEYQYVGDVSDILAIIDKYKSESEDKE